MQLVWTYLRARLLAGLVPRFAMVAGIVCVLLVARPAFADEAAARAHFKKGIELYDRKQYAEALSAFQDAYKEKPSAGVKQNIALSLKGLNRLAEAATAFDEALEEGKDTLKPVTRAAIDHELAELSKSVATVNLGVVTEDKKPVDGAVISVQPAAPPNAKPQTYPPAASRRIRLMPGIYTFTAHAAGYPDPPAKKLALVSGAPVDATFVMGVRGNGAATGQDQGALKVETNVPEAVLRIDGVELPQRGTWSGKVKAGTHRIEVSAPGWKTSTADVTVSPGASVDYPMKLQAAGEAPPEYLAPGMKAPKQKKLYLAVTGAVDTVSYRLAPPLDEAPPYGRRRSNFAGLTIGGRLGYLFAKTFSVELLAELGGMTAKYKIHAGDAVESQTSVFHWQLTPM